MRVDLVWQDEGCAGVRVVGSRGRWVELVGDVHTVTKWRDAIRQVANFSDVSQDYRFLYKLATGGFSEVHVAENIHNSQQVAIKIIPKPPHFDPSRISREVSIMQELDSEPIASFIAKYEDTKAVYIVEKLVRGVDLSMYLEKKGRLGEDRVRKIVSEVLRIVGRIHDKGVIHRDLKLENVIIHQEISGPRLSIIDFGLSTHPDSDPQSPTLVGTAGYVAPEVEAGEAPTAQSDVYSVGVIALALLSGKPPRRLKRSCTETEGASLWHRVSPACRLFLSRLVSARPQDRPSAVEAQQDPWLLDV